MGYRSNVTIIVYGDQLAVDTQEANIRNAAAAFDKAHADDHDLGHTRKWVDDAISHLHDGSLVLQFDGIKWYESYDDVTTVTDWFEAMACSTVVAAEFMRLGEDDTDTTHEEIGSQELLAGRLYCSRSIAIN